MNLPPSYRALSIALLGVLAAGRAGAQTGSAAAAQGLFDQAKALMAAGKATEACPKFEESQKLDPSSGTLINLALCYEKTHRTASAWTAYLDAAAAAKAAGHGDRERGARDRAAGLAPKVSKLVIDVPPAARVPGLAITRDGVDVGQAQWGAPIPSDDGPHAVTASAPGHESWQAKVEVTAGGTTASISVPPLEPAPIAPIAVVASEPQSEPATPAPTSSSQPSSGLGGQRIAALVVGGVGVAGVAIGSIFGLTASSKHEEAAKVCTGRACTTDGGAQAGNDAHTAGNISTVAMIAGGAALAGGVVLWLTAPKRGTASTASAAPKIGRRAELLLSPVGVAFRGAF